VKSIEQVAELLGLSTKFVRAEIRKGRLPAYKLGGAVRVAEVDLEKYLNERRIKPCRRMTGNI
jgi:excisionase family DNA binding protein